MMGIEIVTREDLQILRTQLINDINQLLIKSEKSVENKWLKNGEVMKMLQVSSNTIQRLRISGKLKSSKLGGSHYYRYGDILDLLEKGL